MMADRLYLSYRLRGFTGNNMLRHFEKALRLFPYSRLSKSASVLRIYAVAFTEPVLLEQALDPAPDVERLIGFAKQFQHADCAYQLETCWDIWQYSDDWAVAPARVTIECCGPEFEDGEAEHLRIDCGPDFQFLPDPEIPGSARIVQSNIRSLLKLAHDLDGALVAGSRQLLSESGENFVERLQQALTEL